MKIEDVDDIVLVGIALLLLINLFVVEPETYLMHTTGSGADSPAEEHH